MADTRPTPVGFIGAVRLCLLLLCAPHRFIEAELQDAAARNNYTGHAEQEHRAFVVRKAFARSAALVAASAAVGYGSGLLTSAAACATSTTIAFLQVIGACLLLWGTLFVRGWEIQTSSGVQFTERVNKWLYRFLYCLGTAVVVCSLAWRPC